MIDIKRLYHDHNIPIAPPGNKHARDGWINTHCPICTGKRNYHLGFNTRGEYFYCWRCGKKTFKQAFSALLYVAPNEIYSILNEYKSGIIQVKNPVTSFDHKHKRFRFPRPITSLKSKH